jgi:hypothetical protein
LLVACGTGNGSCLAIIESLEKVHDNIPCYKGSFLPFSGRILLHWLQPTGLETRSGYLHRKPSSGGCPLDEEMVEIEQPRFLAKSSFELWRALQRFDGERYSEGKEENAASGWFNSSRMINHRFKRAFYRLNQSLINQFPAMDVEIDHKNRSTTSSLELFPRVFPCGNSRTQYSSQPNGSFALRYNNK